MQNRYKTFISGGAGFLGTEWINNTEDLSDLVVSVHNRPPRSRNVAIFTNPLESTERLTKELKTREVTLFVHTAAVTDIEECEANPKLAYDTNLEITKSVVAACNETDVKLIFISTDHLSSGNMAMSREESPLEPINTYAKSKAAAEDYVLKNARNPLIVRSNFFGWGPIYRESFSDRIIRNLSNKKPLFLFDDVYFTPIYTKNLIRFIYMLIELKKSGVYNVACDERISKYEFGLKLARKFMFDHSLVQRASIDDRRDLVKRPKDMSLSNCKLKSVLNEKNINLSIDIQIESLLSDYYLIDAVF